VDKVQVMDTLDDHLLKSYYHKDLHALHFGILLAMSSDNASYAVSYTSISSDSNGLSWGIPLMNTGELPEMELYKEPEHLEYHAPLDDDVQDSIDYPDKPEDDYEDPEEDPKEDHTDYAANGEDCDEPFDDDDDDDDTGDEDEEPTKDEEEEEHIAPTDSSAVPVVDLVPSARDTEAYKTDESAPTPRSPQTRVPFFSDMSS
ncbi:hypothetical protein Tco_1064136, partial [Tanacetum coccineum]